MYQGRVYALTKEAANGKYKGSKGQALHFPYLYDTALPHGYSTIHPKILLLQPVSSTPSGTLPKKRLQQTVLNCAGKAKA